MFRLSPADVSADDSTDRKPIALAGVTVKNFRAFLRVLFDPFGFQFDSDHAYKLT